jgi:hypothetical protein
VVREDTGEALKCKSKVGMPVSYLQEKYLSPLCMPFVRS